jgi:hypothetical protein
MFLIYESPPSIDEVLRAGANSGDVMRTVEFTARAATRRISSISQPGVPRGHRLPSGHPRTPHRKRRTNRGDPLWSVLPLPDRQQVAATLVEILAKIDVLDVRKRPRQVLKVAGLVNQRNDVAAIAAVLEGIDKLMLDPLRSDCGVRTTMNQVQRANAVPISSRHCCAPRMFFSLKKVRNRCAFSTRTRRLTKAALELEWETKISTRAGCFRGIGRLAEYFRNGPRGSARVVIANHLQLFKNPRIVLGLA